MSSFKKQYKALILDVDGTLIPNKRDGMPSNITGVLWLTLAIQKIISNKQ